MAKRGSSRSDFAPATPGNAAPATTGFADMDWGTRIAWISLHLLLFLVPIAVSNLTFLGIGGGLPLTFDQFDIIKLVVMRAFTIIALAAWAISLLTRGGRIRFTKIDWLVLGVLAWIGITTITSIHWPTAFFGKYRRFEGLLSFINYAVVYFLTVQLVDRPSRMRSLLRTLFFSGVLVAIYGVLQYLGIEPISYGALPFEPTRSFATYGNPDLLGGFIMFSLPLSAVLALSEDNVTWRTVYWIGTVLNAVMWITAFTRSAWIGGLVAVGLIVLFAFRQKIRLRTEDWVMAGVAGSLATIVVIRSFSAQSEVLNFFARVKSIFEFNKGSSLTRFQIWSAAIDAIKERPIFGFGADTFRLVFPMFKPAAYVAAAGYISVADNVHNYPLQIASAIGIPGFLLLYALFGWILIDSFASAFTKESGSSRILYSGVWASAAGYLVHLFFGLSVTGTTVILWLLLGLLVAPRARTRELKAPMQAVGLLGTVVVVAIAMLLTVGNIRYAMADHQYLLSRIDALPAEQDVAAAQKAVQLNPYNDMYRAEVGLAYLTWAGQVLGTAQQGDTQAVQQGFTLMQKAEESFKDTIKFVPAEYDNYVFLASLYNQLGTYFDPSYFDNAKSTSRKGITVEEYGPAIRVEYARALKETGEDGEAIAQLSYAIKLDPAYGDAAELLAEIYDGQGKTAQAVDVLVKAHTANPGHAGVGLKLAAIYERQGKLAEALKVVQTVEAVSPGQFGISDRISALEASVTTP